MTNAAKSEFVQGIRETVSEVAQDVQKTKNTITELRAEYD